MAQLILIPYTSLCCIQESQCFFFPKSQTPSLSCTVCSNTKDCTSSLWPVTWITVPQMNKLSWYYYYLSIVNIKQQPKLPSHGALCKIIVTAFVPSTCSTKQAVVFTHPGSLGLFLLHVHIHSTSMDWFDWTISNSRNIFWTRQKINLFLLVVITGQQFKTKNYSKYYCKRNATSHKYRVKL